MDRIVQICRCITNFHIIRHTSRAENIDVYQKYRWGSSALSQKKELKMSKDPENYCKQRPHRIELAMQAGEQGIDETDEEG